MRRHMITLIINGDDVTISKKDETGKPDIWKYEVDAYPHGRKDEDGNLSVPIGVVFDDYYSSLLAKTLLDACGIECIVQTNAKCTNYRD